MKKSDRKPSWYKRLGWLIIIWVLSVLALAIFTIVLKFVMHAVGFNV